MAVQSSKEASCQSFHVEAAQELQGTKRTPRARRAKEEELSQNPKQKTEERRREPHKTTTTTHMTYLIFCHTLASKRHKAEITQKKRE